MAKFEYKTEVITSLIGRDKLRLPDLDATLKKHADEGWELVSSTTTSLQRDPDEQPS